MNPSSFQYHIHGFRIPLILKKNNASMTILFSLFYIDILNWFAIFEKVNLY